MTTTVSAITTLEAATNGQFSPTPFSFVVPTTTAAAEEEEEAEATLPPIALIPLRRAPTGARRPRPQTTTRRQPRPQATTARRQPVETTFVPPTSSRPKSRTTLRSRVRVANRARRPIDSNAITAPAAAEEPVVEVPR